MIASLWKGLFIGDRTLEIKNTDGDLFCRLLRPGAIILVRPIKTGFWGMLLSKIIQSVTGGLWSHTANYLGKSFSKWKVQNEIIEAISEGVMSQNIGKYMHGAYQMEAWMRDTTEEELQAIVKHLHSREGRVGYDYTGLLSPVLTCFTQDPNRDYCAELSYNAYELAGEKCCLKGVNPRVMVSPNDLRRYFVSNPRWYRITYFC